MVTKIPRKFNEKLGKTIISEVKKGHSRQVACRKAGISDRTLRRWRETADLHKTNTPLKCFFEELDVAIGMPLSDLEDVMWDDALVNKNTSSAKWLLTKLLPEIYGNHDNNESSANDLEDYIDPAEEDKIFSGVEYE